MKNLLLLSCCITYSTFIAQNNDSSNFYNYFDSIVNTQNTSISNGIKYIDKYRKIKNGSHNFFLKNSFTNGNIIYDNEPFFGIPIKYNIANDELIIYPPTPNTYQKTTLVLEKKRIISFEIFNSKFINSKEYGFLEILHTTKEISLLKKHQKKVIKKLDKKFIYYEFEKKNSYLIKYNKQYLKIKNENSLTKLFPSSSNFIKSFYQQEKYLYDNNYEKFLKKLITNLATNLL